MNIYYSRIPTKMPDLHLYSIFSHHIISQKLPIAYKVLATQQSLHFHQIIAAETRILYMHDHTS